MRPQIWIAALILAVFALGLYWLLGTEAGSAAPRARPEKEGSASLASGLGGARSVRAAQPASPEDPGGGPDDEPERPIPPFRPVKPRAADPTGSDVRALVRDAVALRRARNWAGLARLQARLAALTRRDVNILLHLLKQEADADAQLMIGDLLARHAEAAGPEALEHARATLARVYRRLMERSGADPTGGEARERAAEHLVRWAGEQDVADLVRLLRESGESGVRQAAALAVARVGDAALWTAPLRAAAGVGGDLQGSGLLAVAVDGVAARTGDDAARRWVRESLLPAVRQGIARCADPAEAMGALGSVTLVTARTSAEEVAAAWGASPDPADRRRLLRLLPEVVSGAEDLEVLRARLATDDPALRGELDAALAALADRGGR